MEFKYIATSNVVVFACNKPYYTKFLSTYHQLRTAGAYKGPVVLVIGDDLVGTLPPEGVIVKHFKTHVFSEAFLQRAKTLPRDPSLFSKMFQFNKFHVFDDFFKQWAYAFYIDCGMNICQPIDKMLELAQPDTILAHSDAFPTYEWKLHTQFCFPDQVPYNLEDDYFQTGIMLYDTSLCTHDVPSVLFQLLNDIPTVRTNDQAIIALYFTQIRKKWKQIPTRDSSMCFYDFCRRDGTMPYIMHKY